MFRTVTTFFTAVTDVLDDILVGDAELEAAEFARWQREHRPVPAGRWRELWDAAAQDAAVRERGADAARSALLDWSAEVEWVADPSAAAGALATTPRTERRPLGAARSDSDHCLAEGRSRPAPLTPLTSWLRRPGTVEMVAAAQCSLDGAQR